MNKYYDEDILIDMTEFPKEIRLLIQELEQFSEQGDWLNYDSKFDELEIEAKSYVIQKQLSEKDYQLILRKYGWLCD